MVLYYFENANKEKELIGTPQNEKGITKLIKGFCTKNKIKNDFKKDEENPELWKSASRKDYFLVLGKEE